MAKKKHIWDHLDLELIFEEEADLELEGLDGNQTVVVE